MKNFRSFLIEKRRAPVKFKRLTKKPYIRPEANPDMEKFNAGIYPRYIREKEMTLLIKKLYNSKVDIAHLAQIAIDHKFFLYDSEVLTLPSTDVWKYREYDRDLTGKWSGSNTQADVDELRQSIAKEGIRDPLTITIDVADKEVYLGEGNHRLGLAIKELNIKKVPVNFRYLK